MDDLCWNVLSRTKRVKTGWAGFPKPRVAGSIPLPAPCFELSNVNVASSPHPSACPPSFCLGTRSLSSPQRTRSATSVRTGCFASTSGFRTVHKPLHPSPPPTSTNSCNRFIIGVIRGSWAFSEISINFLDKNINSCYPIKSSEDWLVSPPSEGRGFQPRCPLRTSGKNFLKPKQFSPCFLETFLYT